MLLANRHLLHHYPEHIRDSVFGKDFERTYTTIASYSCSINGYFPDAHDYVYVPQVMRSWAQGYFDVQLTGTSWALTGFVATTFLAGAVVWNDRLADLRALGNVFLNIVSNSYVVDDVVNEEERKGN